MGVPNNARDSEGSTTREELHLRQIDAGNGWKEGTAVCGGCGGCGAQGAEEVPAPKLLRMLILGDWSPGFGLRR